jgi:hypothetical protein
MVDGLHHGTGDDRNTVKHVDASVWAVFKPAVAFYHLEKIIQINY